jgi:hypothetical protein
MLYDEAGAGEWTRAGSIGGVGEVGESGNDGGPVGGGAGREGRGVVGFEGFGSIFDRPASFSSHPRKYIFSPVLDLNAS